MKWYEAKDSDDLKKIGKLSYVKEVINTDIRNITGRTDLKNFIKMSSNSWDGEFKKVSSLKKLMFRFAKDDSNNLSNHTDDAMITSGQAHDNNKRDGYFNSEADKYIFYLLELSGEERMKHLKIYKSLYINKKEAKKWYTNIAKIIHPDVCKDAKAADAMSELRSIYDKMIDNE